MDKDITKNFANMVVFFKTFSSVHKICVSLRLDSQFRIIAKAQFLELLLNIFDALASIIALFGAFWKDPARLPFVFFFSRMLNDSPQ